MTSSNVLPLTEASEAADTSGLPPEFVPGERIVPAWLSLEDLDVIADVLRHFIATSDSPAAVQQHVADLQKHFAWVRSEFTTSRTAA
jgi:hypothetical protein